MLGYFSRRDSWQLVGDFNRVNTSLVSFAINVSFVSFSSYFLIIFLYYSFPLCVYPSVELGNVFLVKLYT